MSLLSELPNLITPLPIYGLLLVFAIAWRTRKAIWWGVLAWAYLMSLPVGSDVAVDWLEQRYQPIADLEPYQGYPVVLLSSGGTRQDPVHGQVNLLANSGWERLLIATTTARKVNGELFVAGGPSGRSGGEPMSVTIRQVIEQMGIDLKKVTVETTSTNTFENLANLKDQLLGKPFILVTSASHLPRAMAVAAKLELMAIAQPADYLSGSVVGIRRFLPSSKAIRHWQVILHEVVGFFYYKVKGYR